MPEMNIALTYPGSKGKLKVIRAESDVVNGRVDGLIEESRLAKEILRGAEPETEKLWKNVSKISTNPWMRREIINARFVTRRTRHLRAERMTVHYFRSLKAHSQASSKSCVRRVRSPTYTSNRPWPVD